MYEIPDFLAAAGSTVYIWQRHQKKILFIEIKNMSPKKILIIKNYKFESIYDGVYNSKVS